VLEPRPEPENDELRVEGAEVLRMDGAEVGVEVLRITGVELLRTAGVEVLRMAGVEELRVLDGRTFVSELPPMLRPVLTVRTAPRSMLLLPMPFMLPPPRFMSRSLPPPWFMSRPLFMPLPPPRFMSP
jgi:hypothetical protein